MGLKSASSSWISEILLWTFELCARCTQFDRISSVSASSWWSLAHFPRHFKLEEFNGITDVAANPGFNYGVFKIRAELMGALLLTHERQRNCWALSDDTGDWGHSFYCQYYGLSRACRAQEPWRYWRETPHGFTEPTDPQQLPCVSYCVSKAPTRPRFHSQQMHVDKWLKQMCISNNFTENWAIIIFTIYLCMFTHVKCPWSFGVMFKLFVILQSSGLRTFLVWLCYIIKGANNSCYTLLLEATVVIVPDLWVRA